MCMDDEAFDECNQLLNIFWLLAKRLLEKGEGKKFDYRDTRNEMLEEQDWKEIQMENNKLFLRVITGSKFEGKLIIQHGNIENMLNKRFYGIENNVNQIETAWIPVIRELASSLNIQLNSSFTTWHAIVKLAAIAERLAGQHS